MAQKFAITLGQNFAVTWLKNSLTFTLSSYWTQYVFLTFATAQSGGLSNVTAEGVSALWRRAGADIGA